VSNSSKQTDEPDSTAAEQPLPFAISDSYDAEDHLHQLPAAQRSLVLDRVDQQLTYDPSVPTRHRKPLRKNLRAPWELRIGDLRVFYEYDEAKRTVTVVAIGVKVHGKLNVGGKEYHL
jgi:mRNA-degrading endonuclease RelE of RelBE toxin-antitoxin system